MNRSAGTESATPNAGTDSDIQMLATGGTLNIIGAASQGLLNFVVVLVLMRGLGAAGSGAFFQAVGIFTILGTAAVIGADTGLVRALPQQLVTGRQRDVIPTLRAALLPLVFVTALAAYVVFAQSTAFAAALTEGTHTADVAAYLKVLAIFVPLYSLAYALLAATRGMSTMVPGVVLDKMARPLLQSIMLLVAVTVGASPSLLMMAWAVPSVVVAAGAAVWLRRLMSSAGLRRSPRTSWPIFIEFWRFTLPRAVASICRVTIQWFDVVLVGAMVSPRDAGIYAAVTRLLILGTVVSQALAQVSQPMFSRLLSHGSHTNAGEIYRTSTGWLIGATWPLYFSVALFGSVILSVFGAGFPEGAVALAILALARLMSTGVGTADVVLLMGGKSAWSLGNTVVALAINIGLNLVLIPRYGIAGAAVAWAAAAVVNNVAPLVQVRWLLKIHPYGRASFTAAAATSISYGVVGLAVRSWLGSSVTGLVVYLVIGSALYVTLLLRWRAELRIDRLIAVIMERRGVRHA